MSWSLLWASEPDVVYLTWVDDPTTTMTVVWHGKKASEASSVMFHPLGESKWALTVVKSHLITGSSTYVHVAHIQGLQSDSTYVFKFKWDRKEYQFRTLPQKLSREVRFVVGGDLFYDREKEAFERMNWAASFDDPDFVVLGGDLAYTTGSRRLLKGRKWEIERWQDFFKELQKTLRARDGRLIPIIPVVGNHDVHRRTAASKDPEIFYEIFPFPVEGQAYRSLQIGNYLELILLDTGHTWPIEGKQTKWLKEALDASEAPYLFAAYHVGAYPSVYNYKGTIPDLLRQTWVPLFEEAHIGAAFEHHSHALKRTYPILQGKRDPDGVIYLGDGSWGVVPRQVHTPESLWYLKMSASVNACWFIHLTQKEAQIEARTATGDVLDRLILSPREKALL